MNTFGVIKTKLEEASILFYKNNKFDVFMGAFNKLVLENKDICELYYIYEDLSSNKGLDKDIVDEYINENVEYSKVLIEENEELLDILGHWLNKMVVSESNDYKTIDTLIYNDSIKNLETVLECKKQIKNNLVKESKIETTNESVNLPLETMVKMYEQNLKRNLNLDEKDLQEVKAIKNISKSDLEKEIKELTESIISKLKPSLNESTDLELNNKIENTINSVLNTKISHYDLYKLRKLNEGL